MALLPLIISDAVSKLGVYADQAQMFSFQWLCIWKIRHCVQTNPKEHLHF